MDTTPKLFSIDVIILEMIYLELIYYIHVLLHIRVCWRGEAVGTPSDTIRLLVWRKDSPELCANNAIMCHYIYRWDAFSFVKKLQTHQVISVTVSQYPSVIRFCIKSMNMYLKYVLK